MAIEQFKESQGGLLAQARHYWRTILKWKWTAFCFFLTVLIATTLYSFIVTPVFVSSGSVWIEDQAKILPFEGVQSFGVAEKNLQSHALLLQSRTLAAATIDKLKLYENPDFAKLGKKISDPADPIFRERLIRDFLKKLSVTPLERTSLVSVQFSNRNPRLAADALNALFDGYIEMIVRKRYSASEQASEFLSTQIAGLRDEIETKERELNKYGSEKDIPPLTAGEAPTVSRIAEINKALTDATIERVTKLTRFNQLNSAALGEIPDLPEGSLIQRLREQYVSLSRQYASRLATVRPEYPEMQRLKSDLDSATEALQNETRNLIQSANSDYRAALDKEQSLQRLLSTQKNEAYKANSNSVIYNSLRIELENRKALMESLSKRQSETDVSSRLKGLEALNVWIVDKANYPLKPAFPKRQANVLMGMLFGLIGGVGLALGLEYLNHTAKTTKDVSSAIGIAALGSVPAFEAEARPAGPVGEFLKLKSLFLERDGREDSKLLKPKWDKPVGKTGASNPKIELIAAREPQSIQAESYRSIRTSLMVSAPLGKIKTILFTSPLAREGKSSTISNLGITLAEAKKQVVIVDSDLRRPKQARIFGVRNSSQPGLSSYLSSNVERDEIIKPTDIPGLHLITSGPLPSSPIELLASEKMDDLVAYLKRSFDFILFDTPPLLAVSDALAMGPMVDTLILIIRGGHTPIPAIKQAQQKLAAHKIKCLGFILNGVDLLEQDGYYARQYYHYSKAD